MKAASLAALALLLLSSDAHADAVPPEPDDCPEGAVGDTDHGGPHCRPTECTTSSECKDKAGYWGRDKSFTCKADVGLCVKVVDIVYGKRPTAMDDCDDDGDCDDGAKCIVTKRCVEGEPPKGNDSGTDPSGGQPKSKCGCELAPVSALPSGWWLLGAGALAWRRRSR